MPRVDPTEYESLPLEGQRLIRGFSLHDVWLVELEGATGCTLQDLRRLVTSGRSRDLNPIVRCLFLLRSILGRLFRLDSTAVDAPADRVLDRVPPGLAHASLVPPGTQEGPFTTLYALPNEAAYEVVNATVHAIVVVALIDSAAGPRLYWATYVKPVGRITTLYMRLIDPFRRAIVYPGLEAWLRRLGGNLHESCSHARMPGMTEATPDPHLEPAGRVRDRPTRRTLLLGCAIFLLLGAAVLTFLNWPAIGSATKYNGDVQQSPHWVAYHGDSFSPDNLLVQYGRYNETALQNAIYWVGTLFLDLVSLNKVVGTVFFAVTAALFFLLVSLMSGVRTGALAGLFCLIFPRVAYETSGGFSKAWAIGLVLTAVYVVETRRWPMLLWLMPFAAIAYPVCPILIGGIVLAALVIELRHSFDEALRGLKHLCGGSALALVPLLYKYFSPPANIGEMITPAMMKEMWERKEFGDVTIPLWEEVLLYLEHSYFIYGTVLLLILLASRGLVWKRSWTALVAASTAFYGVSYLVIPSLYLPDRYTRYSIAILLVLWHAHNWNRVLDVFRRRWAYGIAAAALVVLTALSFADDTFRPGNGGKDLNRWNDKSRVRRLSRALASEPQPVLAAGHPYDMGDVMVQSGRPVLAIHRMYHPWFSGYREAIEARIRDTFAAIYSDDVAGVNRLAERYGVTHLAVEKRLFERRRTRKGRVYKPQFARMIERMTRDNPDYPLNPPPPDAVVFEDRVFWLVRLPLEAAPASGDVPGGPAADPARQRQR